MSEDWDDDEPAIDPDEDDLDLELDDGVWGSDEDEDDL